MLLLPLTAGLWACSSGERPPQEAAPQQAAPASGQAQTQDSGRPHGNHDPYHGGLVLMDRDLHFEVVMRRDGEFRVYFTDEVRHAVPASTVEDVIVTVSCEDSAPEVVGMQVDDKDESWVGKAHHAIEDLEATVRISYVYKDVPYFIDVPVRGLQSPPSKADHD
jgi:hypothetical protein